MDVEEHQIPKKFAKKIRVKIITNRNVQFITSVRPEATISQLANRALSVYLELTGQKLLQNACKKQLTVSAVKQGVFYMPKSQCVSNILNQDDIVEVIIIKAKPKYPNGVFTVQQQSTKKQAIHQKLLFSEEKKDKIDIPEQQQEQDQEQAVDKVQPELIAPQMVEVKKPQQSTSKRQKKKEKKEQKKSDKKKIINPQKEIKISIDNSQLEKQIQLTKEKQVMSQSLAKKKAKLQKQQNQSSSQKIPQSIVPSPKITFHADPKLDSPRNLILGEAYKKRINFDPINFQEEENTKKTPLQRILSPAHSLKSPFFVQKTPINNPPLEYSGKQKEKEQLLNFSLPRKASQDKRYQPKKDNPTTDLRLQKQVNLQIKEVNPVNEPINQKVNQTKQSKILISDQEKTSEKVGISSKPPRSLVIVQPESDGQGDQQDSLSQTMNQNHRFKQLAEISAKIKNFLIESDQEK